jgi:Xaa-Pro aminopeptidase
MLIKEKVNQASKILNELNIDCWITFLRESKINGDTTLDFILGAPVTWHSAFIITPTGENYAIVGRYDKQTVEDTGVYTHVLSYVEGAKEHFINCIKEINPTKIAINYSKDSVICDGLTYGMYLTLYDYLREIGFENRLLSAEKIISPLRERKTTIELNYIKQAIKYTEIVYERVAAFIRPGRTEKEIAEYMLNETKQLHNELIISQDTFLSVFTGPDTAEAHYEPTEKKVEAGHLVNMDFGIRFNGYWSDIQRTFYVLKKNETVPPSEVQKGCNTIIKAIELARETLKPGVKGIEVDKVARDYLLSQGFAEFPHGLGHGVGRFVHDGTALLGPAWEKYAQKPFQEIQKDMVFTIEPRLTVPGYGIMSIEEMVLVSEKGAEFLSTPQKEVILIKT